MTDVLSPIEAIMWRVGQTGSLRMTVGAVLIVDRLPDRDALLERLRFAGEHAERLTQRPGGSTSLRSRPSWITGPFAPEHQLRSLSVSAPGTMREVLDLVGLLESVPFDPERSPWDVTLIDGLEDGKAAIYLRAHHVLTDGVGRNQTARAAPRRIVVAPGSADTDAPPPAPKPTPPGAGRGTAAWNDHVLGNLRRSRHHRPSHRAGQLGAGCRPARVGGAQRAMGDRGCELGVPTAHGDRRTVDVAPDDAIHAQPIRGRVRRRGSGCCTGVGRQPKRSAGGCRRCRDRAVPRAPRRTLRRTATGHAGEHAWQRRCGRQLVRADPPLGADGDRAARTAVRRGGRTPGPGPQGTSVARRVRVGDVVSIPPDAVPLGGAAAQAESVDFAATAVPGVRGQRHICGSLIEATYPSGPRLGCPLNITALGNEDRLDIGIALDSSVIRQPALLVESLTEAFGGFGTSVPDQGDGVDLHVAHCR